MDGAWIGLVLTAGLFAMIVLSWPYRRCRGFTLRRRIAAPRERVWDAYQVDLADPANAAFHHDTVSVETVSEAPLVRDHIFDLSGGHGTNLVTARIETLDQERPALYHSRHQSIGGAPSPFGPEESTRLSLAERPGGTAVRLDWRGETGTLWQFFNVWRSSRRFLGRLKLFCETGEVEPPANARRSLLTSLALSVIAVGSFAVWLGWVGALVLAVVLVVHEFGHWLAMRLTGQPAPRLMLIPFLGGVAVANHPHRSQFDDALCALMGPGFSVLPCLGLLVAVVALVPPVVGADYSDPILAMRAHGGLIAVALLLVVGVVNALQLLPVLPLDGGQVLRAMIQSFSGHWARRILLLITCAGMAAFGWIGDYILAAVLGLGALQAWHMSPAAPGARPMNGKEIGVIALGYGLCIAVHGGAIYYSLRYFLTTDALLT
ncbi:MAG: site-2 protease family protein [Pseudomonadota bacterium]